MKNILVTILAITLMASPVFAGDHGGKKKDRKKARTECKMDKCCDPKHCDPTCCDLGSCKPGQEKAGKEAGKVSCPSAPTCSSGK